MDCGRKGGGGSMFLFIIEYRVVEHIRGLPCILVKTEKVFQKLRWGYAGERERERERESRGDSFTQGLLIT